MSETLEIEPQALANMASLVPREARQRLFDDLCKIVGEPIPENIWLATGIRKTDVYRYLPKSRSKKGGLVPNPKTTVRIIKALIYRYGEVEKVLQALDPVERKLRWTYREYFSWKKVLKRYDIVLNPLSRPEMDRLQKSIY